MPCERVGIRFEPKRLGEFGPCFVEIAAQAQRSRKIQMSVPQPRICHACLPKEIDCLIHVIEKEVRMAKSPTKRLVSGADGERR